MTTNPKRILVDADAFVSLQDASDSNHTRADGFQRQLVERRVFLVTSDPAFGEAITVISQKSDVQTAARFAEKVLSSAFQIVEVNSALRVRALEIFKGQTSKNSRFTDCVNMAIMREEGIDTVFSFDEHYRKNGFKRFGIDE